MGSESNNQVVRFFRESNSNGRAMGSESNNQVVRYFRDSNSIAPSRATSSHRSGQSSNGSRRPPTTLTTASKKSGASRAPLKRPDDPLQDPNYFSKGGAKSTGGGSGSSRGWYYQQTTTTMRQVQEGDRIDTAIKVEQVNAGSEFPVKEAMTHQSSGKPRRRYELVERRPKGHPVQEDDSDSATVMPEDSISCVSSKKSHKTGHSRKSGGRSRASRNGYSKRGGWVYGDTIPEAPEYEGSEYEYGSRDGRRFVGASQFSHYER